MKVGLIARSESRGLGHQSFEFARAVKPDRTLLIDMGELARGFPMHPDWYPDATVVPFVGGQLPEATVREWLAGLDVVYAAETLYDWHVASWARDAGCATVVQLNPEFYRHHLDDGLPAPTVWWAPSPWRMEYLHPDTRLVPVPVAADRFSMAVPARDGLLRVLHVAGHRAAADRNGTLQVLQALRLLREPMSVRLVTQDARLPAMRKPRNVEVEVVTGGVADYWRLYDDADVLVMPRRYGGLCLARGTLVAMPGGRRAPIEHLAVGDRISDEHGATTVTAVAARTVPAHVTVDVRGLRLSSSADHLHLVAVDPDAALAEVKAEQVAPGDWMLVMRPPPNGITAVDMGAKPIRKGLRFWPTSMSFDTGWARLIGLWLAEGHRGRYRRPGRNRPIAEVKWSFGGHERGFADEVVSLLAERGLHATARPLSVPDATFGPSTTWVVRCRSLWLDELLERLGCGHGSWGKRAPDIDAAFVPALVGGWLDGDGSEVHGTVSGFSRSTAMIRDLWRLCAKVGVLASITYEGQRLDVSEREAAAQVAGWTERLHVTREYERAPRAAVRWRPHAHGWMVKVRAVEHVAEPLDVVAIETTSGRYIANDVLTHNCLVVQEAMAAGLTVVMSDCAPNDWWPTIRVRSRPRGVLPTGTGDVPIFHADPHDLARTIDRLSVDAEALAAAQQASVAWAQAHSWQALLPLYMAELARAAENAKVPPSDF